MDALKNSGFREEFKFQGENIPNDINKENKKYSQKNRKRKIIWFNPTFCKLASINVGKYFLKLIDKHFKHNNILHKIFNRKTLKNSYSWMKNIFEIINNHNKEIIKEFHDQTNKLFYIYAGVVAQYWFVGFYGISTFVGYLTPNPFLCK